MQKMKKCNLALSEFKLGKVFDPVISLLRAYPRELLVDKHNETLAGYS